METHCYAGYSISPFYDPLLAKLIVRGEDRADAVKRLQAALHDFSIEGIATNLPFLRRFCATAAYEKGELETSLVGRFLAEGGIPN